MTQTQTQQFKSDDAALKAKHAAMWAMGDYPAVATELIAALGPVLVEATGLAPGDHVLDIAAGSGNASIPAALAGADVVASDLTPDLIETGRQAAERVGAQLRWEVADAEALPYADAEFDAAISCVGVMFAPHHQIAADELVRVVRPGGRIGLLSWTPAGFIGQMFATMKPYAPPPPPGAQPPPLWGDEAHVRELLGDRVADVNGGDQDDSGAVVPGRRVVPRLLQAHLRADHRRLPVPRGRPGPHGRARRGTRGPRRPLRQRRPDGVGVPAVHRPARLRTRGAMG